MSRKNCSSPLQQGQGGELCSLDINLEHCTAWLGATLSNITVAAAAAKSLQSCLTLCDPIDASPPGSTVPGILQARILEWVAISFSNAWKWKVKVKSLSHVRLFVTPWTAAYQALPSMGFSRQAYWSGLPLPSPAKINRNFLIISQVEFWFNPPYWNVCCLFIVINIFIFFSYSSLNAK